ncbi:FAD-dependent oxidoreductase [Nonomuraea sp. NPDC050643]|uniref:FAD-dependent oxidoreductase n=1 Tax=Nonomuraea sp. NPDC050643 TaxID=3155660 RepID=UPI0033FF4B2A
MSKEQVDVLVVGGGPVGLATAVFLAHRGVRAVVVERRDDVSDVPRATGLHARTMELFRQYGLGARIAERGMELVPPGTRAEQVKQGRATALLALGTRSFAESAAGFVMESHDLEYEPISPARPYWCGQDLYERILLEDARAHGQDVRFETELTEFTAADDGVTATIEDRRTGERSTIEARYLVGADGVRSRVRQGLGIEHVSKGRSDTFVNIVFRAKLELPPGAKQFTWALIRNPETNGMLFYISPERWMYGAHYDPERGESPADFTPERCVEVLRAAMGVPDLEPELESAIGWQAMHMVADAYSKGRVFLAGDACHAHPPAGGLGVNAGIQDAYNLAWKLAAVVKGWAGPGLLDWYERERRPVGAATAEQAWLMHNRRPGSMTDELRARLRGVHVIANGYQYPVPGNGSVEAIPRELEFSGRPGTRIPHLWLERDGARVSTLDLLGDGLLLLTGERAGGWYDAGREVAAGIPMPLEVLRVGVDVADPEGRWAAAHGITPEGAVLIRPDGFVAWREPAGVGDPRRALGDAVRSLLGLLPLGK